MLCGMMKQRIMWKLGAVTLLGVAVLSGSGVRAGSAAASAPLAAGRRFGGIVEVCTPQTDAVGGR